MERAPENDIDVVPHPMRVLTDTVVEAKEHASCAHEAAQRAANAALECSQGVGALLGEIQAHKAQDTVRYKDHDDRLTRLERVASSTNTMVTSLAQKFEVPIVRMGATGRIDTPFASISQADLAAAVEDTLDKREITQTGLKVIAMKKAFAERLMKASMHALAGAAVAGALAVLHWYLTHR